MADLLRKEYGVPANNPLGFTVFYTKPGAVEWVSGLKRRFGDRILPARYRQPILNRLKTELGVLVE